MEDRKLQQDYLSRKFRKSPERLAMNQGDSYRPKQEQRQAMDWVGSLDILLRMYGVWSLVLG